MARNTLLEFLELDVDQFGRPLDDPDAIRAGIPAWHPRNDDPDPAPDPDPSPDPDPDPDPAPDPDPSPDPDPDPDPDPAAEVRRLQGELRKHRGTERRAKDAEKKLRDAEVKLKEREDADKSEQERAVEAARTEAAAEVETKYETERRDDRIESAVTKLALKGFKVKDGDGEKTLKFEDPDDAQLRLERAIRKGDLSYDDIYSDGKVQTDAVREFLSDLLAENAHLQAKDGGGVVTPAGGADGGKGSGAGKDPEDVSTEDLVKQMEVGNK